MILELGIIVAQQSVPTEKNMHKLHQFLDYATTYPNAIITYHVSNMILAAHSDASYLTESKARSRAGGHFFMSDDSAVPPNNGSVLTISQIIKTVMYSVQSGGGAEAAATRGGGGGGSGGAGFRSLREETTRGRGVPIPRESADSNGR